MSWARGQYLLLETKRRRSGGVHRVILRYILMHDSVIVFPERFRKPDWLLNLEVSPEAVLHLDGKTANCTAHIAEAKGISDPVLGAFTRKYGQEIVRSRYWGQRTYVQFKIGNAFEDYDLENLHYTELEVAFDAIAEEYDRHIYGNPMNSWLRAVSVGLMKSVFRPGSVVVDVGCGTGTETLSLAAHGVKVLACDVSARMLAVLRRKAENAGLSENIMTFHCTPATLHLRLSEAGFKDLDGAYSTYGAFNTDPNPKRFAKNLHDLLSPGASLILGVWNKYYPLEVAGYVLRGKLGLACARWFNPVPIGKSRFCVSSYAYSSREVSAILSPYFKQRRLIGTEIVLPPSNLTKYLPRRKILAVLKKLDLWTGSTYPMNRLGDHFLGEYERE
ncbi:MAG: nitroreductase/quinone reductase family protein [Thermoprotei archaeon]